MLTSLLLQASTFMHAQKYNKLYVFILTFWKKNGDSGSYATQLHSLCPDPPVEDHSMEKPLLEEIARRNFTKYLAEWVNSLNVS